MCNRLLVHKPEKDVIIQAILDETLHVRNSTLAWVCTSSEVKTVVNLEERLESHEARLYTLENLDIPQQVSKVVDELVTDAVDWAIKALLCNRFRDLPKADMKEILHQRMWKTNFYKAHWWFQRQ
nr:hypothetical protein [Tanacetum cinerariifolium]